MNLWLMSIQNDLAPVYVNELAFFTRMQAFARDKHILYRLIKVNFLCFYFSYVYLSPYIHNISQ